MRIISTLFLVTAVANALEPPESHVEHHLRSANSDAKEERDLLSMGATSTSLPFSITDSVDSRNFCFDYYLYCKEKGRIKLKTETDADAEASGNSGAAAGAFSEAELFLEAYCIGCADAYSHVCAFIHLEGDINVDTSVVSRRQQLNMTVTLKTAATTFAMAESVAVAQAYTSIEAHSYTSVAAFCAAVNNMHLFCAAATASTGLFQIAKADAGAMGQAFSLAYSGSSTKTEVAVNMAGQVLDYAQGTIVAKAHSWSFASAQASAEAFASAITEVASASFSAACVKLPGGTAEACARAWAYGRGKSKAISLVCAKAFISAYASADVMVAVSADVDCRRKPVLIWKVADADLELSCHVHE